MNKIARMPGIPVADIAREMAVEQVAAPAAWLKSVLLSTGFLATGFLLAIATTPLAQSYDPDVGSGNIVYGVQPDGSTQRLGGRTARVNAQGHSVMMSYAQELKPGSMLYRSNNKLYAVHNQMHEGKMLDEHAKGWTE